MLREIVRLCIPLAAALIVVSCDRDGGNAGPAPTLLEARRGFATKLLRKTAIGEPVPDPPRGMFQVVKYHSPAGGMAAYLTPDPSDGKKHPAIIWLVGGFSNSISQTAWEPASADNDQSARAFREAGIVMMYPSLRGGNQNPGFTECLYGEVDDVLAAAEYLAKVDYVDPARIYLGGHSTGGTLALLVSESSGGFRAVFSFGPVDDVGTYEAKYLTFDTSNDKELDLRAPVNHLAAVRNSTFIIEGTSSPSNFDSLQAMRRASRNPSLHFHPVPGADHYSTLATLTRLLARKINADGAAGTAITLSDEELSAAVRQRRR